MSDSSFFSFKFSYAFFVANIPETICNSKINILALFCALYKFINNQLRRLLFIIKIFIVLKLGILNESKVCEVVKRIVSNSSKAIQTRRDPKITCIEKIGPCKISSKSKI